MNLLLLNKRLLKPIVQVFLFVSILFFVSCSDDTVTPPASDFDPPRFNWTPRDIYYHGFAGMWALDTNTIFLLNNFNNSLYIVTGNVTDIHLVSNNYYLSEIRGISNNEIYLFGTKIPDRKLAIIKWNGGSFEFFDTDINPVNLNEVRGCVIN